MDYIVKADPASTEVSLDKKTYLVDKIETMKDVEGKDVQIPLSVGILSKEYIQNQIDALNYQIADWQKKLDAIAALPTVEEVKP